MTPTKGYYSVIQYCPDASRLEAANIGVLLLCPELGYVQARTAAGNGRISRFFGRDTIDRVRMNAAKKAIEHRVENDRASFRSPEDLIRFIDTRGNDIVLTPPRPVRVLDPQAEMEALFKELVGGRARRPKEEPVIPALDELFRQPSLRGRIILNPQVVIPVIERRLKIPYAYQNGALRLVKPYHFGPDEKRAEIAAMQLAIEGDLLKRHPEGDKERSLIVVSRFEDNGDVAHLRRRVNAVLDEYHIRVFAETRITDLVAEVERTAHS